MAAKEKVKELSPIEKATQEALKSLSGFKQRAGAGSVYKRIFEIPISKDLVSEILDNADQFGQAKLGEYTIQTSGLTAQAAAKSCSISVEIAQNGAKYEITPGRPTFTSYGQLRLKLVPMSAEPVTVADIEEDELDEYKTLNEKYFDLTEDSTIYVMKGEDDEPIPYSKETGKPVKAKK